MYDANFNDLEEFHPQARPASRRLSFCPHVWKALHPGHRRAVAFLRDEPKDNPECKEYCREECMPGILT